MAQGPLFGAAYVFSICNVQEMLQIDSCTINTCVRQSSFLKKHLNLIFLLSYA